MIYQEDFIMQLLTDISSEAAEQLQRSYALAHTAKTF